MAATAISAQPATMRISWGAWSIRTLALTYLAAMLVLPLVIIFQEGLREGLGELWRQMRLPAAWHALKLTLWTAAITTIINAVMGTLTAYVLVRYRFPGHALLNAVIDLPLAVPTLVTGVMLVVLYGPQQALGAWLNNNLGWQIIFAPPGIILALLFLTFPFVVRAVEPVLQALDRTQENAAASLGASAWTIFRRITLPPLILPVTTGALISFARAIGEFGAIVVVAGNIPLQSQTTTVYILGQIASENSLGASALSTILVAIAFCLILLTNWLQVRYAREAA